MKRLRFRIFPVATIALLAGAQCHAASFNLFPFDPELSAFIQDYRKAPDPKAAIDRYFKIDLDAFLQRAKQADQPHSRPVLMAFYVHIVHDNPDVCIPFAKRLVSDAKGERAAFGAEVLAYGATRDRDEALSIIIDGFKLPSDTKAAYDTLEFFPYPPMEATDWQELDILWACYFATGNEKYIQKIAEPLAHFEPRGPDFENRLRTLGAQNPQPGTPEHTELVAMLTPHASHFGLTENARRDSAIRQAVSEIAAQNRGKISDVARDIVKQLEK